MYRRIFAALAAACLCVGLMVGSARADDNAVMIDNFTFSPASLTIKAGTAVVFTNRDDIPHTVLSDDAGHMVKSKVLDTDDKFSFTFTQPGTYHYHCSIHPHMTGTIIVQ